MKLIILSPNFIYVGFKVSLLWCDWFENQLCLAWSVHYTQH